MLAHLLQPIQEISDIPCPVLRPSLCSLQLVGYHGLALMHLQSGVLDGLTHFDVLQPTSLANLANHAILLDPLHHLGLCQSMIR